MEGHEQVVVRLPAEKACTLLVRTCLRGIAIGGIRKVA
jgi:hypothetical protein